MRKVSTHSNDPVEKAVRDIRRKTRRRYSKEEEIRIVLKGLWRANRASPRCAYAKVSRRVCTAVGRNSIWEQASNDKALVATSQEVKTLEAEARALKEALADWMLKTRLLKKA